VDGVQWWIGLIGGLIGAFGIGAVMFWDVWEQTRVHDRQMAAAYQRYRHREYLMGREPLSEDDWRSQSIARSLDQLAWWRAGSDAPGRED